MMKIEPCNFRSAGRLSHESARTLRQLHELLARNLVNSLDVYLGNALEVKLTELEQFTLDEYKVRIASTKYVIPCAVNPGGHTVLLEAETPLLFTMIDVLLGGSGQAPAADRELTEIDEEIVRGVSEVILEQVEKLWAPIEVKLTPGATVRAAVVHKMFPPTEKMLVVSFDITMGTVKGGIHLSFPAAIGGQLVRNIRSDTGVRDAARYLPRLPLEARMLDCAFAVQAGLPPVRVPVRELAALSVGSILHLGTAVDAAGQLLLESRPFFSASPARSGRKKALELIEPIPDALVHTADAQHGRDPLAPVKEKH
jgi:flagellar motor switch protein FliM